MELGNHSLLLQCPNSGKLLPTPTRSKRVFYSVQVTERFFADRILFDNYDYEEDNTILDCVWLFFLYSE